MRRLGIIGTTKATRPGFLPSGILGFFLCLSAHAQYIAPYCGIQGKLMSSSGLPAQNGTLSFSISQMLFVAGIGNIANESQCATDVNGSVVGIGNPPQPPRVSKQFVGALPPSNYYVKFTWYDQFGAQSLPSPEVQLNLSATGQLDVLPPVGAGPPGAIGMDVYIGQVTGTETYQGQTLTTTAQYTQAVPLGSSVTGIVITAGGLFASCPTSYVFTGGLGIGGTAATGTPVCTPSGADFVLSGVTGLTGGNGYVAAPVVTTNLTPITSPTLTATLSLTPAPPTTNQTACRVVCNDAGWPTGTGYNVSLVDASGNALFNYPEMWQFLGPGSVFNLSNGIPYYHGQVTYPVPVLTVPYNHNVQSISSPLSLGVPGNYYPLYGVQALGVDTDTPAWGVDVEGSGLLGEINANGGYLVNGIAPPVNTCLGSTDGVAFDVAVNCVTSLSAVYYQTLDANGTPFTQRPVMNFSQYFTLTDSASPAQTTVAPVTTGTESKLVTASSAWTPGNCAQWDASGGIGQASFPCGITGFTSGSTASGYWIKDTLGHIHEWGHLASEGTSCNAITFPLAFTTLASISVNVSDDFASGSSIEHSAVIVTSHSCPALTITGFNDWISSVGSPNGGVWWSADGY